VRQFPDLPPVWAIAMILASWLLARFVPFWPFAAPLWLALVLIVAGFGLMLWARSWFHHMNTPMMPRQTPTALLSEGPFRLNRNPIYTGMTMVVLGAALRFGDLSGLLPAIAFPVIITRRFILTEEAGLRLVFGERAERYFRESRRW
jgi:protein-S-isoprenylcysteine O-methyltransferase Ste14